MLFLLTANLCAQKGKLPPEISVETAIEILEQPGRSWGIMPSGERYGGMSLATLQVYKRLIPFFCRSANYNYHKEDAEKWKKAMLDDKKNMYARLCSAYFILDHYEDARKFIEKQLESENLRHRYNAAKIVEIYLSRNLKNKWARNTLIKLLSKGSIDENNKICSSQEKFPNGDRYDIMASPIGSICQLLGNLKDKKAVPALISVLERRPQTCGLANALAEIGDKRAIPILITVLRDNSGDSLNVIVALGKLKAKDAIPLLTSYLNMPPKENSLSGNRVYFILNALQEIGDKRAINAIEKYLKENPQSRYKTKALRVLAQLQNMKVNESQSSLPPKRKKEKD